MDKDKFFIRKVRVSFDRFEIVSCQREDQIRYVTNNIKRRDILPPLVDVVDDWRELNEVEVALFSGTSFDASRDSQ